MFVFALQCTLINLEKINRLFTREYIFKWAELMMMMNNEVLILVPPFEVLLIATSVYYLNNFVKSPPAWFYPEQQLYP